MNESLLYRTDATIIATSLLVAMVICIYIGIILGKKAMEEIKENPGNSAIAASVYALLGLLLAFTFGMSASRYDNRRRDVIEEANNIRIAVLQADLYPDSVRQLMRADFKMYLEARIGYFEAGRDQEKILKSLEESNKYAMIIWKRAINYTNKSTQTLPSVEMIPALNNMIASAHMRWQGEKIKVPDSIVIVLLLLSLISAFFSGYTAVHKGRVDWLIAFGFCVLTSIVVYIILDLDRPRRGFITLEDIHKVMLELRGLFLKDPVL